MRMVTNDDGCSSVNDSMRSVYFANRRKLNEVLSPM